MPQFRKKPVVVEAIQWFKNGDHPGDGEERFPSKALVEGRADGSASDPRYTGEFAGQRFEGTVVRYFRRPDVSGETVCLQCGATMHVHGWIDATAGGYGVCPGDFVITGPAGERYPCKPDVFLKMYERV